jgi:hypothetical protein
MIFTNLKNFNKMKIFKEKQTLPKKGPIQEEPQGVTVKRRKLDTNEFVFSSEDEEFVKQTKDEVSQYEEYLKNIKQNGYVDEEDEENELDDNMNVLGNIQDDDFENEEEEEENFEDDEKKQLTKHLKSIEKNKT